ncbi:Flp family type IVb pilin [Methylobacter sp. sgz302048]|uniref:Flp family type IVb pilin n=1 Tax=Methylobacter sp. sgz302048 TaxID=3455945 RepID=UPI003FA007C8
MKNNEVKGNRMKVEKMKKWLSAFLKDEEGASGIEYALVAAMVAIALVAFVGDIRTAITNIFTDIKDSLNTK